MFNKTATTVGVRKKYLQRVYPMSYAALPGLRFWLWISLSLLVFVWCPQLLQIRSSSNLGLSTSLWVMTTEWDLLSEEVRETWQQKEASIKREQGRKRVGGSCERLERKRLKSSSRRSLNGEDHHWQRKLVSSTSSKEARAVEWRKTVSLWQQLSSTHWEWM